MQQLTRIVAVVVDTKKAVFYKEDGSVLEILQGDKRLRPILDHVTPLLTTYGYADVDMSTENSYKEFEEKSGSTVRFFRIAKEKLKGFFNSNTEPVNPTVVGVLPTASGLIKKMNTAVDEILKHATSVKNENFQEDTVAQQRPTVEHDGVTPNDNINDGEDRYYDKAPDTIVAVTKSGKVIPGVERIKSQFAGAIKDGNFKGIEVFLERIGKVIKTRRHTVEDLLRFMERGDMPIADDGTIIIYKKLYRVEDHYVDPHSRNVKQKVGSYVHMDEKLVDHNRRSECSNGLHVARRGYIQSFHGDVIVLAKVRPEDVITVPDYDANKMRVCGYHIIAELSQSQFMAINKNRPISDAEGGEDLIGRVIAGDHVGVLEHVKITEHYGGGLQITPQKPSSKKKKKATEKKQVKPVRALEAASKGGSDKPVDVKKVIAKSKDSRKSLSEEVLPQLTQADVVQAMWDKAVAGNNAEAQKLLDYKKKAKKGWAVWGLPTTAGDTLKALLED